MTDENTQLHWTDEQWNRVNQVVTEESSRARVAASFLPLFGPLPPDTTNVSKERLEISPVQEGTGIMTVDDVTTLPLATLQVHVYMRGAQVKDPVLNSGLLMFRRAANVLARLEDAIIFNGQAGPGQGPKPHLGQVEVEPKPIIWNVLGGSDARGLFDPKFDHPNCLVRVDESDPSGLGNQLVGRISYAIGKLETLGHLGPFACVLGQNYFTGVQTPNAGNLVLPQDRIIPFLGGGPLLRCSVLKPNSGVVIGLAGAPIDLVVATDVSVNFLQVTLDPRFVFRVYEKIVLRIKEPTAIIALEK